MSKDIALSVRMEALVSMMDKGTILSDVGCDHGYVTIAALQRGIFEKVIAMDINKGPLEAAKNNAREYEVFDKIDFRLSDGLDRLEENEADTILVAGMGGPLICDILSKNIKVVKSAKNIILSPQSEVSDFRKFVLENDLKIEDEELVNDDGKYYFIFKISPSKETDYPFGELGLRYGGLLLKKRHPLLKEYLVKQKKVISDLMEKPGIKGTPKEEEFKTELNYINESMESF